jgi:thioredoxin 1
MIKTLTDVSFNEEINTPDRLVLVDFFATWCGPCQVLGPILEKLSDNFKDKIIFAKADVDQIPINAQKFSVERIPTVIVFKNGKAINTFVGLMPENTIKDWLENLLKENK